MIFRLLAHQGAPDESIAVTLAVAALWTIWIGQDRLRGRGFPRLPRAAAWALVGAGAVVVVGAPFASRALFGPEAPAGGPRPSSPARLDILAPVPGEELTTDTFRLSLRLTDATLTDSASADLQPDIGHLHVTLDETLLSMTGSLDQDIDASALAPGPHSLAVEFVAADHGPFSPRIVADVTFTVDR